MCDTITENKDKILCSRCEEVANPTDSWIDDWPNYGSIRLGYESCIDWELFRKVLTKSPLDFDFRDQELIKSVINETHPAVKHFGFQEIGIEWAGYSFPKGFSEKYRLCRECQKELLAILGQFFFSNLPKEQPIKLLDRGRKC